MSVVDQVKQIVSEVAQVLPGAEVLAPFVAYGSDGMGVQIKWPQTRGGFQECEVVASFVIPRADLDLDVEPMEMRVQERARTAVIAIQHDIQITIRVVDKIEVAA